MKNMSSSKSQIDVAPTELDSQLCKIVRNMPLLTELGDFRPVAQGTTCFLEKEPEDGATAT